eukprot:gene25937-9678_t
MSRGKNLVKDTPFSPPRASVLAAKTFDELLAADGGLRRDFDQLDVEVRERYRAAHTRDAASLIDTFKRA